MSHELLSEMDRVLSLAGTGALFVVAASDLLRQHGQELRAMVAGDEYKAVALVKSVDEYGPCLDWQSHWVDHIGRTLFVKAKP